ncbi:GNAT family N-acetyltransferase [Aurantivibrio plasticivorans]
MEVRPIAIEDAGLMLALNLALDAESDFMLFEPGERPQSKNLQSEIISNVVAQNNVTWMIAQDRQELIGYRAVAASKQRRSRHVGSLVMGVRKPYWGKGVGANLLAVVIDAANYKGVRRIELSVREDNLRGIALYKKFGFVEEGRRNKSLRIGDRLFDELYMARR